MGAVKMMHERLGRRAGDTKWKIAALTGFLVSANAIFWLVTWLSARQYMILLGAGLLAYGFGLRHAVDADHISAIDNTTRRLMQMGKRPVGVGFFFSLGHSTIVLVMCMLLALGAGYVEHRLPQFKSIGAVVGTVVSSVFLYLIGIINLFVLIDLAKQYRASHGNPTDQEIECGLDNRGLLGRLLGPLLKLVTKSSQMYFIGLLFGLGFDTATEVGILALSAKSGGAGIPIWAIMLLPILFTVGMCLVDTLDGFLMLGAYGWAFVRPARKLYYNAGITTLSVVVAFVVGTAELAQMLSGSERGAIAGWINRIDLDNAGFVIVGLFAVAWAGAVAMSRIRASRSRPTG